MANRNTLKVKRRRNRRQTEAGLKAVEAFIAKCDRVVITPFRKMSWDKVLSGQSFETDVISATADAIRLYSDCELDTEFEIPFKKYMVRKVLLPCKCLTYIALRYGKHIHDSMFYKGMGIWLYSQLSAIVETMSNYSKVSDLCSSVVFVFERPIGVEFDAENVFLPNDTY